nr:immunoglobulin light chain junction region [Macaca mulatta]MOX16824.1 immunoglobulin light chain junction region [Macaca mulatta]MOX17401.1 immunoglobulin light chain junction region [Macaca mulatta]MOX17443.1 immunoglobulin light chain junction region [Macaca mulatta]MOX17501.1 immunoglobulin light chain junction region [Macaca mulatta]
DYYCQSYDSSLSVQLF